MDKCTSFFNKWATIRSINLWASLSMLGE